MKHTLYIITLLLLVCFGATKTQAQLSIPGTKAPVILLSSKSHTVTYLPQSFSVNVKANVDYNVTTTADWLKLTKKNGKVVVKVSLNPENLMRTAEVTFASTDGTTTRNFTVKQERDQSVQTVSGLSDFGIFSDTLLTTLKEGTTQADIDTVKNIYARNLAQQIFNGTYDFNYRLATYHSFLNPSVLQAERFNRPYDYTQNATGIMLPSGRVGIALTGLPQGVRARLIVYTWTVDEGNYPTSTSYTLNNGFNIINVNPSYPERNGLAYIEYLNPSRDVTYPDIKVHFINGIQNGILEKPRTNDEMYKILQNAKYTTIDLLGERVHSVFETKALMQYTKGKYIKYINVLDTLIKWEQEMLGLEKYNQLTSNKTLAYVNYRYFMYCESRGASFKYDTQAKVCNPDVIMQRREDALWGMSHEWGHQHQMDPYFKWSGMTEITNNLHSAYNLQHMGTDNNVTIDWLKQFRKDLITADTYGRKRSGDRGYAYRHASNFSFSQKMYDMCLSMKDSIIAKRAEDPDRASTFNDGYPGSFAGFYLLYLYFQKNYGLHDFLKDLYQSLRETEQGTDKYSRLAAAHKQSRNTATRRELVANFKKDFPNSCWTTDNYLVDANYSTDNSVPFIFNFVRRVSLISGFNLYPYFEAVGMFRLIAFCQDDYGRKWYVMTPEMREEFKADMDALVADGTLKAMPEDMTADAITDPALVVEMKQPVVPNEW